MSSNFNLKPDNFLSSCNSKDVISFGSRVFTLRQLLSRISSAFNKPVVNTISKSIERQLEQTCDANLLLNDGNRCELLTVGSSEWQKGRIKLKVNLTLEFVADEPKAVEPPDSHLRNN